MINPQFSSYEEFFAFCLEQHSNAGNRLLHACGTLGFAVLVTAIVTRHYIWALLWIPIGYGFAWIGHFLVEGNKPATFGHPWWSLISDFRMLGLMLTGRLKFRSSANWAYDALLEEHFNWTVHSPSVHRHFPLHCPTDPELSIPEADAGSTYRDPVSLLKHSPTAWLILALAFAGGFAWKYMRLTRAH